MFEYKTQILFRFLCLAVCRSVCDDCGLCIAFDSLKYNLFYLYVWTARAVMGRGCENACQANEWIYDKFHRKWLNGLRSERGKHRRRRINRKDLFSYRSKCLWLAPKSHHYTRSQTDRWHRLLSIILHSYCGYNKVDGMARAANPTIHICLNVWTNIFEGFYFAWFSVFPQNIRNENVRIHVVLEVR